MLLIDVPSIHDIGTKDNQYLLIAAFLVNTAVQYLRDRSDRKWKHEEAARQEIAKHETERKLEEVTARQTQDIKKQTNERVNELHERLEKILPGGSGPHGEKRRRSDADL